MRRDGYVTRLRNATEEAGLKFWDYANDPIEERFQANVRWEKPGCSLCMGNQAKVLISELEQLWGWIQGTTFTIWNVLGSFTRINAGRVGDKGKVYAHMGSPDVAMNAYLLGEIPTMEQHLELEALVEDGVSELNRYHLDPNWLSAEEEAEYQRISASVV